MRNFAVVAREYSRWINSADSAGDAQGLGASLQPHGTIMAAKPSKATYGHNAHLGPAGVDD